LRQDRHASLDIYSTNIDKHVGMSPK
jgi:hypothetical protein